MPVTPGDRRILAQFLGSGNRKIEMDETVKELLKNVRVAAPCSESWEGMPGSDRIRSCERCQHKVYNLSEMTAPEAADLLRNVEGRLCVRFYRRSDGTLMTKDCPVGVRAVQMRIARTVSVAFGSLMAFSVLNLHGKPRSEYPVLLRLLLNAVAPEPTTGRMSVSEPIVGPAAPLATPAPKPVATPHAELFLGQMVVSPRHWTTHGTTNVLGIEPLPEEVTPTAESKPFLVGLPVHNEAPRDDPFAKLPRDKKALR